VHHEDWRPLLRVIRSRGYLSAPQSAGEETGFLYHGGPALSGCSSPGRSRRDRSSSFLLSLNVLKINIFTKLLQAQPVNHLPELFQYILVQAVAGSGAFHIARY
jgi:hypothetical protein